MKENKEKLFELLQELDDEQTLELLQELDDEQTLELWNEYCSEYGRGEDNIYYLDEWTINDLFYNNPFGLLNSLDDDFDKHDEYFKDGTYGLESFSDIFDVVDLEDLAEYILNVQLIDLLNENSKLNYLLQALKELAKEVYKEEK